MIHKKVNAKMIRKSNKYEKRSKTTKHNVEQTSNTGESNTNMSKSQDSLANTYIGNIYSVSFVETYVRLVSLDKKYSKINVLNPRKRNM